MEGLLITTLSEGVGAAVTIRIFAGMLVSLDPRLAALAPLVIPVLAVAIGQYTGRSREAARAVRREASALAALAEEALGALPLVKAYGRGAHERGRFARQAATNCWPRRQPTSELVSTAGMVAVHWVGVNELSAGRLTLGGLVVFLATSAGSTPRW